MDDDGGTDAIMILLGSRGSESNAMVVTFVFRLSTVHTSIEYCRKSRLPIFDGAYLES